MTTIEQVRALVGNEFDDMPEAEAVRTLESVEKKIGRPLKSSEASFLRGALTNRKSYLERQAGIEQPKFVPEMYGTPRNTGFRDDNNEGEV